MCQASGSQSFVRGPTLKKMKKKKKKHHCCALRLALACNKRPGKAWGTLKSGSHSDRGRGNFGSGLRPASRSPTSKECFVMNSSHRAFRSECNALHGLGLVRGCSKKDKSSHIGYNRDSCMPPVPKGLLNCLSKRWKVSDSVGCIVGSKGSMGS